MKKFLSVITVIMISVPLIACGDKSKETDINANSDSTLVWKSV